MKLELESELIYFYNKVKTEIQTEFEIYKYCMCDITCIEINTHLDLVFGLINIFI